MKIISDLRAIKKFKKPVVALGIFDGVHLGHRCILKETVKKAKVIKGTSVVITFWPHPQKEYSLYSLGHRLRLIAELGIDVCVVIKFTPTFSKICAEKFIKDILAEKLGANYVFIGKNFRFGRYARGDYRLLKKLSSAYNFKLKVFEVIRRNHKVISSSYIRRLIIKGKLDDAQRLLSRPVTVLGTVIKGASLGRKLGFPTANINPHHEILPPKGVYAVKLILNHKQLYGLCYIGAKPTIKSQKPKSKIQKSKHLHVEVYIDNFNKNIYGRDLEIRFIKKIRDEKKFTSYQSLAHQIKKDISLARKKFFLT